MTGPIDVDRILADLPDQLWQAAPDPRGGADLMPCGDPRCGCGDFPGGDGSDDDR